MNNELSDQKLKSYVDWGTALSRVKDILLECRTKRQEDNSQILIEATRHIQKAIELSSEFPKCDLRLFLTLSTAIALYCHLRQYSYVELDRQIVLRLSKRYPRPAVGEILNSLGMLYQEHNKLKEAAQLYKRAIKLVPASHPRFELIVSNLDSITDSTLSQEIK